MALSLGMAATAGPHAGATIEIGPVLATVGISLTGDEYRESDVVK
jgi:hypothetical protein